MAALRRPEPTVQRPAAHSTRRFGALARTVVHAAGETFREVSEDPWFPVRRGDSPGDMQWRRFSAVAVAALGHDGGRMPCPKPVSLGTANGPGELSRPRTAVPGCGGGSAVRTARTRRRLARPRLRDEVQRTQRRQPGVGTGRRTELRRWVQPRLKSGPVTLMARQANSC